ncbi:hypothetical protein AJ79_01332 [Helicocarpus griseus UAMH5409]|uniref:Uncharacterized protein n=1 Tax=Helicocarpus griseus UAMH5409 TaxID=1447875 RepID=A0A2B7XZG4_9EURO|nr:hypothetical protein AJ79_01332 [Helicocarpus griseus UAMH5409]
MAMSPILNWAILLFVTGGFAWYYKVGSRPRIRPPPSRAPVERHENGSATRKTKRKAKRSPDNASSSATPTPPAKPAEVPEKPKVASSGGADADNEGMSNLEFARQLAKAKEGTKLSTAGNKAKKEIRTKKIVASPTETGDKDGVVSSTRTSSTTGADADDDMSSVNSPVVNPTQPVAGDVSDMLEPPPAPMQVLRLVNSSQDVKQPQKKQKEQKPVETKKQRQRRIKNENRKAMVEEAEKERRIQLEKQLHIARENERRQAAKSKPAATNAWKVEANSGKPNNNQTIGVPKAAETSSPALLDTFDPTPQPTTKTPVSTENTRPSNGAESWANNLPSEEEQMRIIMSENEWTTVSSRKKERRKGQRPDSPSETSSSDFQAVKEPEPSIPEPSIPATTAVEKPVESFSGGKGHPLDSDWDP